MQLSSGWKILKEVDNVEMQVVRANYLNKEGSSPFKKLINDPLMEIGFGQLEYSQVRYLFCSS